MNFRNLSIERIVGLGHGASAQERHKRFINISRKHLGARGTNSANGANAKKEILILILLLTAFFIAKNDNFFGVYKYFGDVCVPYLISYSDFSCVKRVKYMNCSNKSWFCFILRKNFCKFLSVFILVISPLSCLFYCRKFLLHLGYFLPVLDAILFLSVFILLIFMYYKTIIKFSYLKYLLKGLKFEKIPENKKKITEFDKENFKKIALPQKDYKEYIDILETSKEEESDLNFSEDSLYILEYELFCSSSLIFLFLMLTPAIFINIVESVASLFSNNVCNFSMVYLISAISFLLIKILLFIPQSFSLKNFHEKKINKKKNNLNLKIEIAITAIQILGCILLYIFYDKIFVKCIFWNLFLINLIFKPEISLKRIIEYKIAASSLFLILINLTIFSKNFDSLFFFIFYCITSILLGIIFYLATYRFYRANCSPFLDLKLLEFYYFFVEHIFESFLGFNRSKKFIVDREVLIGYSNLKDIGEKISDATERYDKYKNVLDLSYVDEESNLNLSIPLDEYIDCSFENKNLPENLFILENIPKNIAIILHYRLQVLLKGVSKNQEEVLENIFAKSMSSIKSDHENENLAKKNKKIKNELTKPENNCDLESLKSFYITEEDELDEVIEEMEDISKKFFDNGKTFEYECRRFEMISEMGNDISKQLKDVMKILKEENDGNICNKNQNIYKKNSKKTGKVQKNIKIDNFYIVDEMNETIENRRNNTKNISKNKFSTIPERRTFQNDTFTFVDNSELKTYDKSEKENTL